MKDKSIIFVTPNINAMVYITQSNARRILKDMDTSPFKMEALVIKYIQLNFLSRQDKESIAAFRCLCKSPKKFAKVYQKLDKHFNYRNVFVGGYSCYHSKKECSRLTAPYFNIVIPKSICDKGAEARDEFRKWFNENLQLYKTDNETFTKLLKEKYGLCSLIEDNKRNTGVYSIENMSVEELTEKCNEIRRNYLQWKQKSKKNKDVIDKFGKQLYLARKDASLEKIKGISEKVTREIMIKCDEEFRKPFIHYVYELYRIMYNPDLAFDKKVLSQLGFMPCSECYKKEEIKHEEKEVNVSIEKPEELSLFFRIIDKSQQMKIQSTFQNNHQVSKSALESASLYEQFKNVKEVAKQRNLAISTVYGHLFMSGTLDPNALISKENFARALDIWTNKQEGEQIRPKLEAFLDVAGIAAFYHILRNK